jgi:hypothetical protein
MKALYKNLIKSAAGASMCLFLALPAIAQRTPSSGGSSGGSGSTSHSSGSSGGGGGSVAVSHSSGGSSVGVSRSSGGGGVAHSSSGGARYSGSTGVRGVTSGSQRPTYAYRQGALIRNNPGTIASRTGVAARGNYGYAERVGVASTVAYRSGPKIGFGHARTGGYWGTHGYYHFNHGNYQTYYYNHIGFRCRRLAYGFYPFYWADLQYFYCDGLFYNYDNDEYTVVEPPVGAEVATICEDAQSIVINGQQYYECTGVYYQKVTKDDGSVVYVVAGKDGVLNTDQQIQDDQPQGPQLGDIVTKLPSDCRKIKVNNEVLYVSPDGVYYQEIIDSNGNKTYKIVGLPADEATPDQGTD